MNRINTGRMHRRATAVREAEAERARRAAIAEMVATPLGRAIVATANALVRAFQPGAWRRPEEPVDLGLLAFGDVIAPPPGKIVTWSE